MLGFLILDGTFYQQFRVVLKRMLLEDFSRLHQLLMSMVCSIIYFNNQILFRYAAIKPVSLYACVTRYFFLTIRMIFVSEDIYFAEFERWHKCFIKANMQIGAERCSRFPVLWIHLDVLKFFVKEMNYASLAIHTYFGSSICLYSQTTIL